MTAAAAPMSGAGFNEGKDKPFSAADIRFTAKGETVCAFVMGRPEGGKVSIKSMGSASAHLTRRIARVELFGTGRALAFRQRAEGLQVTLPADACACLRQRAEDHLSWGRVYPGAAHGGAV